MGVGSSSSASEWLTEPESAALLAFSSPTPLAFDAEDWTQLLALKWPLHTQPKAERDKTVARLADRCCTCYHPG